MVVMKVGKNRKLIYLDNRDTDFDEKKCDGS